GNCASELRASWLCQDAFRPRGSTIFEFTSFGGFVLIWAMKSKLLVSLLSLTLFVFNCTADFRAGIAVRVVTPDPLLPVSGGVGPSHPVTHKEGELTVRALVLEHDGTRVAIVSSDFLGFPSVLGNRVRGAVTEIPGSNI